MKNKKNVRVYAENTERKAGYSIYLSMSGKKCFVSYHRPNGALYSVLKDGIEYNELKRLEFKTVSRDANNRRSQSLRKKNAYLEKSVKHLISVVDEYLEDIA